MHYIPQNVMACLQWDKACLVRWNHVAIFFTQCATSVDASEECD